MVMFQKAEYDGDGDLLVPREALTMLNMHIDGKPSIERGYWHTFSVSKSAQFPMLLDYLASIGAMVYRDDMSIMGKRTAIYFVEDPAAAEAARDRAARGVPYVQLPGKDLWIRSTGSHGQVMAPAQRRA